MSVRHIHARPGEYIAVHRKQKRGISRSDSIIAIIAILVAVSFWKFIVTGALIAAILYLIYIFRLPLGNAIRWSAKQLWSLIRRGKTKIG